MISPQVNLLKKHGIINDAERYSELRVLRSAGGYYIGTIYSNPEGYTEPGSRDSHYFPDKASAELYLEQVKSAENPIPLLRLHP